MRALAALMTVTAGLVAGVLPAAAADVFGHPPGPPPARERLLLLAAAAGPAAGDTSIGRYSRIQLRRWVRTGTRVTRFDSERWRAADGSGRLAERRLDPPGTAATRTDFPPGGLPLRPAGPGGDPAAVVTSLLDMIGIRYLDRAERAAVLRTVAGLPGLAVAGRTFTLPAGEGRLALDVDPATGEIVAWQYDDAVRVEVLRRDRVPDLS
ncbi:hypothetical protein ACPPVO_40690 [Dactylosporangium sp. McL0621]|uniref:hypothetical protein n=1 Tax=Dactylosporangium sp. McL0621 TaxID=3415678 RepID=UPI003CECB7C4